VPRWRESTVFTPLERDVMEYAEAMTETPPQVTDELFARLLEQLGAPAMVELTSLVGFANSAARRSPTVHAITSVLGAAECRSARPSNTRPWTGSLLPSDKGTSRAFSMSSPPTSSSWPTAVDW